MPITINGTTGISGVDGSAGTPAWIGSDADTGFYVTAGQISASLNGTAANVPLVQGTAQSTTSGTSIDFTGIPSWAKRITVAFNGVSTNGFTGINVQIGTGSTPTTTGYNSTGNFTNQANGAGGSNSTTGFIVSVGSSATGAVSGTMTIVNISGNTWISSHAAKALTTSACFGGGDVTLSGALGMLRATTGNGTDAFDAGSVNIFYE